MVQSDIHDKESKRKMEKDTRCEGFEYIDSRLPLQNARLERGETNNQTWRLDLLTRPLLRISTPKSSNGITTIPSIRIQRAATTHTEQCLLEPNTHQYSLQKQWNEQCNKQE
ncbi:MAG: hypothetical protein EZS28_046243 [Streblomastix strix]|uniref:Uncharacterized protein n=1 Tax=Streblomastix strix TaxID=222440 RepID=A0A5J4TL32_9EUKA|nr:MAG: hypothetical protein EZS28_046243 [Streblomastix strix]